MKPFATLISTEMPVGYGSGGISRIYDPDLQAVPVSAMGDTSPTTYSSIASTGWLDQDSDEGTDDKGKD